MVTRRTVRALVGVLGLLSVAGIAYALRWRTNPSPCPYARRRWIGLPRPVITRARLRDLLEPQAGERILEVGSGTGYYTLPIAQQLEPGGAIHAVDIQREMLEQLRTQATARGRENVVPVHADGQTLPYPDDTFDAAYLVLALGEIPNQQQALAELHRVVKPGGRLVVGELLPDPHFVTRTTLRRRASQEGFEFDTFAGTRVGYFGRFHVPASPA
ncbi:class I SAM-dependent methyltransferase [Natronorubrum aibiense]|uniref:Methyltransferase domain-containing protein n=1 Tax=Natronorubrum aibiense TaxID=348826 RepID=A0A5P9P4R2_9EURY|nr:methyltransferase domain-containing protein [Natronorubrum aibiense]QFU83134.1 methyltransferase domain-containing protein [Natronorubrum aibiense]